MPTPTPADPPFYRCAAKFLAALAAAVVGTSATILAAVDDDHVTGKEWAAIILGVLALVAGPATVYKVRNAAVQPTAAQARALLKLPGDFVGEAVVRQRIDGTVETTWPHGRGSVTISPQMLEAWVREHNQTVTGADPAHDGSAAAQRAYPSSPPLVPPQ